MSALVAGLEAAGAPDRTRLWAMLETPRAVLDASGIVGASDRLTVLVMGTNDLAKELHAAHVPGREPLRFGLQQVGMLPAVPVHFGVGGPAQQGRLRELLCVGTDITRRREMEDEARRYQQRLREP